MGASHLKKGPGLACLYCVLYSQIWELFLAKCPQEMFCAITIYPTFLLPLLQTTLINTPPQSKRKKLNVSVLMVFPESFTVKRDDFRLNLSFSCSLRQAWYISQFINKEARGELINTTLAISAQYWIYWAAAARCRLFTNSLSASTSCSAKSFVVIFSLMSFVRGQGTSKEELIVVQLRVTFARKKSYTNAHIWRECWVKVDVEQKDWRALANALFLAGKRWEGVLECCLVSLPAQTCSPTWWWRWQWGYLGWWWLG